MMLYLPIDSFILKYRIVFVWPCSILFANLPKKNQVGILPEDLSTWGPCCCCSWSSPPSSPTRKAWRASGSCSPSPTRTSSPQGLASPRPPSHCSSSCSSSLFSSLSQPLSPPSHPSHLWGVFDPPPSLGPAAPPGRGALALPAVTVSRITPPPADEKRRRRRRGRRRRRRRRRWKRRRRRRRRGGHEEEQERQKEGTQEEREKIGRKCFSGLNWKNKHKRCCQSYQSKNLTLNCTERIEEGEQRRAQRRQKEIFLGLLRQSFCKHLNFPLGQ